MEPGILAQKLAPRSDCNSEILISGFFEALRLLKLLEVMLSNLINQDCKISRFLLIKLYDAA